MVRIIAIAIALLPAAAGAVICKTVDADGVVSYSEMPAAVCDNPVNLPEYSSYKPRIPQQPRETRPVPDAGSETGADAFGGYESLEITEPVQDGTVRDNSGKLTVVLALTPTLQPDHRVRLSVDGQAVSGNFDGLAIELSGVDRGVHRLQATVVDAAGRQLIQSQAVEFTMRQASRIGRPQPRAGG